MRFRRLVWRSSRPGLSVADGIVAHYRTFFGDQRVDVVRWTPEHLGDRLPDFQIARIRPTTADGMWIYGTVGAWRATEYEGHGLEFVAVARRDRREVMEQLGQLAYYHAGTNENRLGLAHLVPLGEGWIRESTLTSVVVTLPYPWGPDLEHCQLLDRHIQVLWVMPITAAEHAFARLHGLDALEAKFEETSVDYLDPFRSSVV
jgi:hypothetical protein